MSICGVGVSELANGFSLGFGIGLDHCTEILVSPINRIQT